MNDIINYNIAKEVCTGIYRITSPDNYYYIGSAKNIRKRYHEHVYALKHNKHSNPHIQNRFNKTPQNWKFELVITTTLEQLIDTERALLKEHFGKPLCMNCTSNVRGIVNRNGKKRTQAQKDMLKGRIPWNKGKILGSHSETHKANIRAALVSRVTTPTQAANISKALKGRKLTDEWKQKISRALMGNTNGSNTH